MRSITLLLATASLGISAAAIAQTAAAPAAEAAPEAAAAATEAAPAAAASAEVATTAVALDADGKVKLQIGTPVVDAQQAPVGTLKVVETDAAGKPTNVVLQTDKHEVKFPASSLARTEKFAVFGMTRAQVNAAADAQQAQATATN